MNRRQGPLTGIRVLDFGQYIAGPGAAQILSDLGATVIKIENVRGDQARSIGIFGEAMIRAYNRDKSSLALDLTIPEAQVIAHQLLSDADVLIHNFRPGAAERLGLGADVLREQYPSLVYAAVTGFGAHGPSSSRPGLDIAAQAEFGIMQSTGAVDGDPQRIGFSAVDVAAANALATGIMAALYARVNTGKSAHVQTSLMEAAMSLQAATWGEYTLTGQVPRRKGNGQAHAAPAADLVRVEDGMIVLSAYTDTKWAALCHTVGHPEFIHDRRFIDNAARVAHRSELLEALGSALGHTTRAQAVDLLLANGIVCGAIRGFDEIVHDQDIAANNVLVCVNSPQGDYTSPGLAFTLDGQRPTISRSAPELGEHNTNILSDLGYTDSQIDQLHALGALSIPPSTTTAAGKTQVRNAAHD